MRYRDAGVDVRRADAVKAALGHVVPSTWSSGVRSLAGGFAGVMEWPHRRPGDGAHGGPEWPGAAPHLLAATMDGVGTKLHLAQAVGRVGDAAADLVYHCANDLLVHGARPVAFLDYLAQRSLDPATVQSAVEGLSRACREVGAVLLGGETAEMPDTYLPDVIDVAGCMIGWVSDSDLLDGSAIRPDDSILGLASNGLHTNGYSLARRVLDRSGLDPQDPLPGGGESLAEALLKPHRWYGPVLLPEIARGPGSRVHGLAHVTGGGLAGNLKRVLGEGLRARVRARSWPLPALFRWLLEAGDVPHDDAREALNLGIGMAVVCPGAEAPALAHDLRAAGETVYEIGTVVRGECGVEWVED